MCQGYRASRTTRTPELPVPPSACPIHGPFPPSRASRAPAHPRAPPSPQNPPGKDVEAPFMALATTFHRNYEEKVGAFQDACRNY